MKKSLLVLCAASISLVACQQKATKEAVADQQSSQEAIAIHDEIMPQIGTFDRTSITIDSILSNLPAIEKANAPIDTTVLKADLLTLKTNLESATDQMMSWMRDYTPDSTDVEYQKAEITKIKAMKKLFEDVAAESSKKLSFKK